MGHAVAHGLEDADITRVGDVWIENSGYAAHGVFRIFLDRPGISKTEGEKRTQNTRISIFLFMRIMAAMDLSSGMYKTRGRIEPLNLGPMDQC